MGWWDDSVLLVFIFLFLFLFFLGWYWLSSSVQKICIQPCYYNTSEGKEVLRQSRQRILFNEISFLEHVHIFQSSDFIEGFFQSSMRGSGRYTLPDKMLRLDANITLHQTYVLLITLANSICQIGDEYIPSIHSWDISSWQLLYIPLFFYFPGRFFKLFVVQCLYCSNA